MTTIDDLINNADDKIQQLQSLFIVYDKNVIASKTDTKGIITYASKAYQEISGYSEEELIGSPHNIVRHPDMPKSFYKQMWNELKKGHTWIGHIKNMKKNGEFYWVKATIEPEYKNGKISGYTAIRQDITAKKQLQELTKSLEDKIHARTQQLENQLYTDSLTSLGSYQALLQDVKDVDFLFTAIILINIDGFQNINNIYGFTAGNNILKDFAQCLNVFNQYKSYKIYRIYADEFILFKNCQYTNIDEYYEDIISLKEKILNHQFYIPSIDDYIQLDATLGVSLGQENPLSTVDMALKYAKKHKLDFQTYNESINLKNKLEETIKWKNKIKDALENDMILPVFQPILDINENIIKYEVLTRMQETQGDYINLISPNEFLEESINLKQYNNIVQKVFDTTFKVMESNDKLFSINISYDDVYNHTLIQYIESYLKQHPHIANRLVIEILESIGIENYDVMNKFIEKFKSYGVKIAIDDFGTGHSNLSHILNIKPDYLKIDGSFIKDIDTNQQSYAMVKSIIAFCKELNITIVAEYVHNKTVFDTLKTLGVDEFQGFYFYEPMVDLIE